MGKTKSQVTIEVKKQTFQSLYAVLKKLPCSSRPNDRGMQRVKETQEQMTVKKNHHKMTSGNQRKSTDDGVSWRFCGV